VTARLLATCTQVPGDGKALFVSFALTSWLGPLDDDRLLPDRAPVAPGLEGTSHFNGW
jgi:hypothetical protein